ncbi:alkaline phosphatase [Sunxiuqinia sp. A32]|uniref:alkaline phosphatase n=1 Tax=Sunxiuqinia sp. A32 TaxID=3461496 RepID=UPI0040460B00
MKYYSCLLAIVFSIVLIEALAQEYSNAYGKVIEYKNEQPYETVFVQPVKNNKVKNVILMIGDGMGLTQVSTAWVANHGRLNIDNFTHVGLSRTTAANRLITDSGASGTAMATGQKANYHSIGVDVDGNPLASITDLAIAKNLSTGIVVTCGITDATPATFCANNEDREMEEDIALNYLTCGVDFIFGGGRNQFIHRQDNRNLMDEMKNMGYQVESFWDKVSSIQKGKVFALLEDGQLPLYPERGDVFKDACMKAISILDQNKNGFFALLEGSRIDDCGHWNDIPKLMNEMIDFDQTIGKVLEWAEDDGNTLVVVLADHETGGLTLLDGDISDGLIKISYSTGGHSGILVPVYAYGPKSEMFDGMYENTEVFERIVKILKLK